MIMKIEREFIGSSALEDIILSVLTSQIDKILLFPYDKNRADAIPSETDTEGMVNK